MSKLNLLRNLSTCALAKDVQFFVGDSAVRIGEVTGRLTDPSTRTVALKELQAIRAELASAARLWASAQMLVRIEIADPDGTNRTARAALGVWLAQLPAEAFPADISPSVCRILGVDGKVLSRAVSAWSRHTQTHILAMRGGQEEFEGRRRVAA